MRKWELEDIELGMRVANTLHYEWWTRMSPFSRLRLIEIT
jgi:hypothetical protein